MVQPSISTATSVPALARAALQVPADPSPSHDEGLLVAALERIELTRVALDELLCAGLSGLPFL
jgi:hypothetical protein